MFDLHEHISFGLDSLTGGEVMTRLMKLDSQDQQTLNDEPPQYSNRLVTQLLKRTHDICQSTDNTNPFVTLPQLVRRFCKWEESTSTSPSRRHLGHYKSLLPPFVYNINEYAASLHGEIMNVHVILLNFCTATGYSLKRWHKLSQQCAEEVEISDLVWFN